jgi:hypothetical protein
MRRRVKGRPDRTCEAVPTRASPNAGPERRLPRLRYGGDGPRECQARDAGPGDN